MRDGQSGDWSEAEEGGGVVSGQARRGLGSKGTWGMCHPRWSKLFLWCCVLSLSQIDEPLIYEAIKAQYFFIHHVNKLLVIFQVALSQDDLTVLMKILLENLGEASSQPSPTQSAQEAARVKRDTRSGPDHLKGKSQWELCVGIEKLTALYSVVLALQHSAVKGFRIFSVYYGRSAGVGAPIEAPRGGCMHYLWQGRASCSCLHSEYLPLDCGNYICWIHQVLRWSLRWEETQSRLVVW